MIQSNVYESQRDGLQSYISKVFLKMASGLAITAIVAYLGYRSILNEGFVYQMFASSRFISLILVFVQFGLVFSLSRAINEMNPQKAKVLFYAYSGLTGVTFSFLPMVYGGDTVFQAFALSAVMFGSCAVIGSTTKVDLSKFSGLLYGGVIALILASLLGRFVPAFQSTTVSFLGIFVFLGLTAYDMQKLKSFYYQSNGFDTTSETLAVYGAFQLYLDFINVFLYVLQILGNRRD